MNLSGVNFLEKLSLPFRNLPLVLLFPQSMPHHLLSLARLNCQNYLSELFILVSNQPAIAARGPSNSTQPPFLWRLSDSASVDPQKVSWRHCGVSLPVMDGPGDGAGEFSGDGVFSSQACITAA